MGVSTPPKWSRNVPMCLRNLQKIFGSWGPNRSWDIDLPTPPCICSTWPGFWALALCLQVCQHLPSGLEMFPCVSGTSKKHFGACKHNEKWPQLNFRGTHTWLPRGLCTGTWPPGGHVLVHRVAHTWPPRGLCAGTWHPRQVIVPAHRGAHTWPPRGLCASTWPLGVHVPAPDPLGVKRYLCTACFKILHTQISHLENSMLASYQVPT